MKYADLRCEDIQKADELLREVERICRYWNLAGSERMAVKLRIQMRRNRERAAKAMLGGGA